MGKFPITYSNLFYLLLGKKVVKSSFLLHKVSRSSRGSAALQNCKRWKRGKRPGRELLRRRNGPRGGESRLCAVISPTRSCARHQGLLPPNLIMKKQSTDKSNTRNRTAKPNHLVPNRALELNASALTSALTSTTTENKLEQKRIRYAQP